MPYHIHPPISPLSQTEFSTAIQPNSDSSGPPAQPQPSPVPKALAPLRGIRSAGTSAEVRVSPVALAPMTRQRCFMSIEIVARVVDENTIQEDGTYRQLPHMHRMGELEFNDVAQSVTRNGNKVLLSNVHYAVFKYIWENRQQPSTPGQLAANAWPADPVKPKSAADEIRRIRDAAEPLGIRLFREKKRIHVELL